MLKIKCDFPRRCPFLTIILLNNYCRIAVDNWLTPTLKEY